MANHYMVCVTSGHGDINFQNETFKDLLPKIWQHVFEMSAADKNKIDDIIAQLPDKIARLKGFLNDVTLWTDAQNWKDVTAQGFWADNHHDDRKDLFWNNGVFDKA